MAFGSYHEYKTVFRTKSKAVAGRFVYLYTTGFIDLLKEVQATGIGTVTDKDDKSETAAVFYTSFKRQDMLGYIDVFMYQGSDGIFNIRVSFFEDC